MTEKNLLHQLLPPKVGWVINMGIPKHLPEMNIATFTDTFHDVEIKLKHPAVEYAMQLLTSSPLKRE
jgi:hypothetical protein